MSILGQKIREIRIACGMNQAQFADETGVSQGTVSKWERGDQIPETPAMIEISRLGHSHSVNLYDLVREDRAEKRITEVGPRTELSPAPLRGGPRDLPVPGIALGGSEEDGDFQLNGEIQYYLDRPAGLIGRKRAFAVVIRNDSMIESYKPGWPIFVDPDGRQPVAGVDDVLIELYPEEEGRSGPAFVKKLLARRGAEVVLWQQNPAQELRFPIDRVKQTLRVIPYVEAMGLSI